MTPDKLQSQLNLEIIQPHHSNESVATGYTSDLLSDVMANAVEGAVLITIQSHANTVAVASIAGIRAIIICNSRPVAEDTIEAAAREKIAIYRSTENQFTVSYKAYKLLHTES